MEYRYRIYGIKWDSSLFGGSKYFQREEDGMYYLLKFWDLKVLFTYM